MKYALVDALMFKGLSKRQAEVAEQVARGLSNKVVAQQLFVCEKTVKFHLTYVYKTLKIKTRAELIVLIGEMLGASQSNGVVLNLGEHGREPAL